MCVSFFAAPLAYGQDAPKEPPIVAPLPDSPDITPEEEAERPDVQSPSITPKTTLEATPTPPKGGKDLTIRSPEDRADMLEGLFKTLKNAPDAKAGELIAEEIWAVFLQSGSASVDFALLRGVAAQTRGDLKLARRMFDHVTRLEPTYAEGWSRSGRLALEENDLNRAASDTMQSLVLEPRHFFALWTLGNIFEKLGRQQAAFEAYSEAGKLYPKHKEIKERLEFLRNNVKGQAL